MGTTIIISCSMRVNFSVCHYCIMPGFMQDLDGPLPEHLHPFWAQECWSWHTAGWWRYLWERTGLVNVEIAESMPDGWQVWLRAEEAEYAFRNPEAYESGDTGSDAKVLREDKGRYIGFIRMIARRDNG